MWGMAVFTVDDQMQPVYCVSCRVHIPRALSSANGGLCDPCKADQDARAAKAVHDANQKRFYDRMKAMGYRDNKAVCLYCGQPSVWVKPGYDKNQTMRGAGCALGMLCLWPLLLLALLPSNRTRDVAYCQSCEREYTI